MLGILEKPTGDNCNPQNHHLRELLACDRNLSAISSFAQPSLLAWSCEAVLCGE